MKYRDVQLNFEIDEDKDLMIIFVNNRNNDDKIVHSRLIKAINLFAKKYHQHIDKLAIDVNVFENFSKDLVSAGIIQSTDIADFSSVQQLTEKTKQNKPIIASWWKGQMKI